MNIIATIQKAATIFSLLPTIISGMGALEASFPGVSGVQKLDVLKGILQGVYTIEQESIVAFEDVWPTVENLISKIKASPLFATSES